MQEKKQREGAGKGEFIYDDQYDILTFKIKDREYKLSIELQNLVVDFDSDSVVSGLRVLDASVVFGVDKTLLSNIVGGYFKADIENNVLTITFRFQCRNGKKEAPMERFSHQITTKIASQVIGDSSVECPVVS